MVFTISHHWFLAAGLT